MKKVLLALSLSLAAHAQVPSTVINGSQGVSYPNDSTTGTTAGYLTKLTSTGNAIKAATTDTTGILGCATTPGTPGTSGSVTIAISGIVQCVFDGTPTAGDYVEASPTVAGQAHDFGTSPSAATTQCVGRVATPAVNISGVYNVVWGACSVSSGANTPSTALLLKGNGVANGVVPAAPGTDYVVPSGNVATATALAASPTNCTFPQFALGILASGNSNCGTPSAGVGGASALTTPNAGVYVASSGVLTQVAPPTTAGLYAWEESPSGTSAPPFWGLMPTPASTLLVPVAYSGSGTYPQGQQVYDGSGNIYESLVGANNGNALPTVPTVLVNSYWRVISLMTTTVTGGTCPTASGLLEFSTGITVNGVPSGCQQVPYSSLAGPPTSLAADATAAANASTAAAAAQATANAAIPSSQAGAANGVAQLNSSGQVAQVDALNLALTGGPLSGSVTGPSFVPQNTTAGPNTGNPIDDFFTLSNITTTNMGVVTGGGCNQSVGVANHPGILYVTSGTAASTGNSCNWGNSGTNGNFLNSGLWFREADVQVPVLPGTTAGSYYVGVGSSINTITPSYGAQFYLSSANGVVNDWYCRYNSTTVDSTVAAVASAWTRLTIKSDGTNMHYLINGTEVCGTGIAISNLSTNYYLMTAAAYTTSTTSVGIYVDYFTQWQQVTR